jgi:MFS family permease
VLPDTSSRCTSKLSCNRSARTGVIEEVIAHSGARSAAPKIRAGALLAVLLTGQALANIDTAIVNVATPSIHTELNASGAQLQLIVFGYILAYAMLLITGARLGQIYGYRSIFLIGVAAFTLASLASGLAPEPITLIVARVIQGVGAALIVPQVLSGIQLSLPETERGRALGLFVMVLSASAVVGQVLGGALISADLLGSGWRPVFLINVPIGAVLMLAALRYLPLQRAGRQALLDVPGVITLSAAMLLALVPLILGREQHWPLWTWLSLLASVPAFALFIGVERRVISTGGKPLVNLHILTRPTVSWALGSRAAATSTYFSLLFVLALYLQQGLGESPFYSGLALVSWVAAFGIGGWLLRRLSVAVGRHAATVGSALMAAAYFGIGASVVNGQAAGGLLIILLGIGGFGFGLATTALLAHLVAAVPVEHAADISGLYNTNSQVAAVVGVATFGTAYLGLVAQGGQATAMHAFAIIAMTFAMMALLAAIAAARATRRPLLVAVHEPR